jgi:hypothetical protein
LHFTLADLITDIAQNAIESGAERVELEVIETDRGAGSGAEFRFVVRDNGKGMDKDELKHALDPFVSDGVKHPGRKIGLGLPFLIQTAEQSGGGWDIQSDRGQGTMASAWFDTGNLDTPPAGDLAGMFRTVILFEGPRDVIISRSLEKEGAKLLDYRVCKTDLAEALGDLDDTGSLVLLDQYLRSLESEE